MEDVGKALIMAAQIIMFVFAATISLSLYHTLTESIDSVMLAHNYSNRGDSIVGNIEESTERKATKAEVIMAILDLKSKYEKTGDNTYNVEVNEAGWYGIYEYVPDTDSIKINGVEINCDDELLRSSLNNINNALYTVSYDQTGKVLIYTE